MEMANVKEILNLVTDLLKVPYSRIWTMYDEEADYNKEMNLRRLK